MQITFIGSGSVEKLSVILRENNFNKVLLFRGKKSFEQIQDLILPHLKEAEVVQYSDFSPNPWEEEVIKAVDLLSKENYDCAIAVGGGSVIDFAKAYRQYAKAAIPLIAVPTTAGTGSEATQFSVIYIGGAKASLDKPEILPEYAIADSQLLAGSGKYLKACTGMDAFCQAIESYWAVGSTPESKKYARQAIELCRKSLIDYVLTSDAQAAENMMLASNLAGQAINISRTTAAHALSYTFTSKHGIAHGHAVALNIAGVFLANLETDTTNCNDVRGVGYIHKGMDELLTMLSLSKENVRSYFNLLMDELGLEWRLDKLGLKEADLSYIRQSVNPGRLKNNPKDLVGDLQHIWG